MAQRCSPLLNRHRSTGQIFKLIEPKNRPSEYQIRYLMKWSHFPWRMWSICVRSLSYLRSDMRKLHYVLWYYCNVFPRLSALKRHPAYFQCLENWVESGSSPSWYDDSLDSEMVQKTRSTSIRRRFWSIGSKMLSDFLVPTSTYHLFLLMPSIIFLRFVNMRHHSIICRCL